MLVAPCCTVLLRKPSQSCNHRALGRALVPLQHPAASCIYRIHRRANYSDPMLVFILLQVYVNGTLVGGSDSLTSQIADGSFQQLLAQPSSSPALPQQLQQAVAAAAPKAEEAASAESSSTQQLPSDLQQLLAALSDPHTGVKRQRKSANATPSFTGKELLDWLVQHGSSSSTGRSSAAATAQKLLEVNVITLISHKQPAAADVVMHDDNSHSYAMRSEAVGAVPWGQALNTHYWWGPSAARPAEVVAEDLRGRILRLYDKHLSRDGRSVSYKGLKADPGFWEYVDATAELQRVSLSGMSREALMCFAINLYNALVIHALVVHGPEQYKSTTGRLGFFSKAAKYNIGGSDYVLDDLENGILRGNRPAASSIGMLLKLPQLSKGPFKASDPRAAHVVSPVDPRIHFALVCGAKSCPPIKLYSPDTLEEGLSGAAEAFIVSDVEVDRSARKVHLSKIFSWYYPDFGSDKAERLKFLLQYLPERPRQDLQQMLAADPSARGITVQHKTYDWDINAADE
eukprot:GHUV01009661.1.p1 GENE.GHUV01009661.1~~GHUV01009661.1.p1  ORF type:complete len:515 (+),score=139.91 GHUV01009661.1:157-1701(+)